MLKPIVRCPHRLDFDYYLFTYLAVFIRCICDAGFKTNMEQRLTDLFLACSFFSASSRSAVQVPLPPPEGALLSTPGWKTNGQSEAASLWQGHPDILEVHKTHGESVYSLLQVQHVLKACITCTKVWRVTSCLAWLMRWVLMFGQRRVQYHVIIVRFKATDYAAGLPDGDLGNTPTLTI